MFGKYLPVLFAVAAMPLLARAADADVILGYDVNSSPQKASLSFDGFNLSMLDGNTTIDFSVEVEETGMTQMFDDALITLDAELTHSEQVATSGTLLQFAGEVTFNDASSNHILSFTFNDSSLYLPNNATSSALTWSSQSAAGSVSSGSAMSPLLGGQELILPAGFAFTLTSLEGDAEGFEARSSFSADAAMVPEPTSLALLGLCSAMMLRRRRRFAA